MIFWMLAREVMILRGMLNRDNEDWEEVKVDLFYFKNVEEVQKQLQKEEEPIEEEEKQDEDEENEEYEQEEQEDDEEEEENWDETNN